MQNKKVLITGITGFLGSHTAIAFLKKGYAVVGTIRNFSRKEAIKKTIVEHTNNGNMLSFVEIDLASPQADWDKALTNIDYVVHIASPFPTTLPKSDDELIIPAKQGTLNVLNAATKAGVKRVVITSSSGAAVYGNKKVGIFTEKDWTNIANLKDTTAYFRSKTIAEKAAWDFVKQIPNAPELVSILPGAILGPVLEKDFGTSANIVKKLLDGSMPAMPKIGYEMVDVRSVAQAFINAIEIEEAKGERFLCTNGYLTFSDIAKILKDKYPTKKIPSGTLPNFMVRFFSNIDKETKPILNDLETSRKVDNSKIKKLLKWQPIELEKAVVDTAESLLKQGII
ncbi:SDR family oxidoreductase [Arcicella rigui]|uniref:Aldehyde reductase n=1 Tax=Arcicella rigui TaxID=797020 RepID=A0ABU5Q3X2_9BACT|nr:aldehyde reductase [Arcicella rigui]MEA5137496.1 aldehyde reductase [Arcicella rigui]